MSTGNRRFQECLVSTGSDGGFQESSHVDWDLLKVPGGITCRLGPDEGPRSITCRLEPDEGSRSITCRLEQDEGSRSTNMSTGTR